jgi:hypothetical protein
MASIPQMGDLADELCAVGLQGPPLGHERGLVAQTLTISAYPDRLGGGTTE